MTKEKKNISFWRGLFVGIVLSIIVSVFLFFIIIPSIDRHNTLIQKARLKCESQGLEYINYKIHTYNGANRSDEYVGVNEYIVNCGQRFNY